MKNRRLPFEVSFKTPELFGFLLTVSVGGFLWYWGHTHRVAWLAIVGALLTLAGTVRVLRGPRGAPTKLGFDSNGITFYRLGIEGSDFVPWGRIRGASVHTVQLNKFLYVHLDDAAAFYQRRGGLLGRLEAAFSRGFGDVIVIPGAPVGATREDVVEFIRFYSQARQAT